MPRVAACHDCHIKHLAWNIRPRGLFVKLGDGEVGAKLLGEVAQDVLWRVGADDEADLSRNYITFLFFKGNDVLLLRARRAP